MHKPIFVCVLSTVMMLSWNLSAQEHPRVLIQRGERFLAMGNLDAALVAYRKVTVFYPETREASEAHNDMGVAYARKGQAGEAIREYERSLSINDYPLAKFNLGRLLLEHYKTLGDEQDRRRSLDLLSAFHSHLHQEETLPRAVEYQRTEIDRFLLDAIEFLERGR